MKAALVFAGGAAAGSTFLPYRSRDFLAGLADAGVQAVVLDPDQAGHLPQILAQDRPSVIQTFGATVDLAPVWRAAASTATPLLHFVASAGPTVERPARGAPFSVARAALAQRLARRASRAVAGVLGSNRADIGRHFERGFFPRARFSMVAPPPTDPIGDRTEIRPGRAEKARRAPPVLGLYDPEADGASLDLLLQAVALTGQSGTFALRIAPPALASRVATTGGAEFVAAAGAAAFVRDIDVLVVPRAHDRALAAIVAALAARKGVIVPDTGVATEIVDYGRCGLLYAAGSAYHLAMAINVMTEAWDNRPLSFDGVDDAIGRTTPAAVARVFATAWHRLAR